MKKAIILFTVFISTASAQILLDTAMTKEEQKETGISTLTFRQKVQLENWLNNHCVLKTNSAALATEEKQTQELTISMNIQGGRQLQLSDNSLWEVAPNDIPNASFWVLPIPIKVSPSSDPNYPTLLTNLNSGISVRVRKADNPAPSIETPAVPAQ